MSTNKIILVDESEAATHPGEKSRRDRILVVDDDPLTRGQNVGMLIDQGYDAEEATDGADGWEALRDRHFDLVITDNSMAKMTGVEMIEKFRSSGMTIPVIMATGTMPHFEFARKPWLRPDVALIIPFSEDELLAAISNVLRKDHDHRGDISPDAPKTHQT